MLKPFRLLLCFLVTLFLSACGQSGALYMPDEAKKKPPKQQQSTDLIINKPKPETN